MITRDQTTREQLVQFLADHKNLTITVLTGDRNDPGHTSYAHYLTANHYEFIDGDGEISDGIIFRYQTDDDIYAEILLAVNNLHFLHQDNNLLVYTYPQLLVQVDDVDPHPYVVIERK